jgi:hypothetical protein
LRVCQQMMTVRNLRNITIAYISQGPEGLYYKNLNKS